MTMLEKAARALFAAEFPQDDWLSSGDVQWEDLSDMVEKAHYLGMAAAVLRAIREPSEAALAAVVQNVSDPSPDNWARAERVCAVLGGPRMEGETACAELARDWTSMIDQILSEAEAPHTPKEER